MGRKRKMRRESKSDEICSECGRSVARGSGLFIDRVPDFNTVEERREMGRPYPQGDYICRECIE